MRIGVLGCFHETNTFAPGKTELADFKMDWYEGKDAFLNAYRGTRTSMGGVIDACDQLHVELVPLFYTQAMPSSMVSQAAWGEIERHLLKQLDLHSSNLDGLVVILHGAMVSEQHGDVEGRLLRLIRERVEAMPVVATIDLHANVTEEMVAYADILVGYDTYPHIDAYERAIEAVDLLIRQLHREIKPVSYLGRTDLLMAPTLMNTNIPPMKLVMEQAFSMERDPEVLNITITGGFAFSDVPFAGFTVIVTCDRNEGKARTLASELIRTIKSLKASFKPQLYSLEQACEILSKDGKYPAVLIESSDNVGGGSPADATHAFRYLYERSVRKFLCVLADVEAVTAAFQVGVGGKFQAEVGGKTDRRHGESLLHGEPVPITGRVKLLSDGKYVHKGPYMMGMKAEMGRTAVIELANGSVLVITEKRVAPWDVNHVRSIGIAPEEFDIIVVKAAVAWRSAFGDIATAAIELDTPGCCSSNLVHLHYQHLPAAIEKI